MRWSAVSNFNAGTTGLTPASIVANTSGTITINATPTAGRRIHVSRSGIVDAIGATLNKTYTVTVNPALTITAAIPQGTAGHSVSANAVGASAERRRTPRFNVTGFRRWGTNGPEARR